MGQSDHCTARAVRKRQESDVADSDIHLKLDRILFGQDQLLARIREQDETIAVLAAGLSVLREAVMTQTETITRLAEAMSKEEGSGDLVKEIASIAVSLKQIQQDGARMVVLVGRLPTAVAQAAQDAVLMAMGDGVDIPPGDRE
jgi:phosphoserine phosphatase